MGIIRFVGFLTLISFGSIIVICIPKNKYRLLFCQHISTILLWILNFKLDVRGSLPKDKQIVILANHVGLFEIIGMMNIKGIRFVAQSGMRDYPFLGWAMRRTGQIFVDRKVMHSKKHLDDLLKDINAGNSVAMFPEGRVNDARSMHPFKSTLLKIVEDDYRSTDFTIVPMAICYRDVGEEQRKLIHWWQDSIMSYIYNMCKVGSATLTIEILQEIPITGSGHCAKHITNQVESQISDRFYALYNA